MSGLIKQVLVVYEGGTTEAIGAGETPVATMKNARNWLDFSIKAAGVVPD